MEWVSDLARNPFKRSVLFLYTIRRAVFPSCASQIHMMLQGGQKSQYRRQKSTRVVRYIGPEVQRFPNPKALKQPEAPVAERKPQVREH